MATPLRFRKGDFVEVWYNGHWLHAMVEGIQGISPLTYHVCIMNTATKVTVSSRYIRTNPTLSQDFLKDFEDEIPDLTQQMEDNPLLLVSQPPWDDSDDFVQPRPLNPPKKTTTNRTRFPSMTEAQIDELQLGSKAYNTHRATQWGLKVFRGEKFTFISFHFVHIYLFIQSSLRMYFFSSFCTITIVFYH